MSDKLTRKLRKLIGPGKTRSERGCNFMKMSGDWESAKARIHAAFPNLEEKWQNRFELRLDGVVRRFAFCRTTKELIVSYMEVC